jgi:hypothetical protein
MKTGIKIAAVVAIVGAIALVAVSGAALASSANAGYANGSTDHGGMMGAQCQSGGMSHMMNGNGQPCDNPGMQSQMTKNADGTWSCPGNQNAQASA